MTTTGTDFCRGRDCYPFCEICLCCSNYWKQVCCSRGGCQYCLVDCCNYYFGTTILEGDDAWTFCCNKIYIKRTPNDDTGHLKDFSIEPEPIMDQPRLAMETEENNDNSLRINEEQQLPNSSDSNHSTKVVSESDIKPTSGKDQRHNPTPLKPSNDLK